MPWACWWLAEAARSDGALGPAQEALYAGSRGAARAKHGKESGMMREGVGSGDLPEERRETRQEGVESGNLTRENGR